MQTLSQIRSLLEAHNLAPQKQFGQCFLIDHNLMAKLVDLAAVGPDSVVLEVGPGTGSLTEELLARARRVVAVEIDRGLAELIREQFAPRDNFTLVCRDVLETKHTLAPEVVAAVSPRADLVSNLPYNVATPLIAQCLIEGWRSIVGHRAATCRFDRLTFTVQREVADRLAAAPASAAYGPVSVLVTLLGRVTLGPVVPGSAFWPRPSVASRIVRIDLDEALCRQVVDLDALLELLNLAFAQRRKQIGSILHRAGAGFSADRLARALQAGGIERTARAEDVPAAHYLRAGNDLLCP